MVGPRILSKTVAVFLVVSVLVPVACQEEKETIDEYGRALMAGPEKAKVTVDLSKIRPALEAYRMDHDGKYPPNLKDLKLELHYPDEYVYNPTTGKVRSKNYPLF